ncbi:ras-like protein RAS2 [Dysidea avara]|uniref:ras-like protein RAS2 n=1 Tax=Dysidea avara TaxID=196820 RepID=UPI0033268F66
MDKQKYKVVVAGGGGVGKSAITIQFTQAQFVEEYDPTIEDTYTKQCVVDGEVALLDILDTAGQEEFSAMREQYMHTGDGFLLVYSVIDKTSFEDIRLLHRDILRVKDCSYLPMVLVANKVDIKNERSVASRDGEELAATLKIDYAETSAKERIHIDETFHKLIQLMREFTRRQHEEKKNGKKGNCTIL